MNRKMSYLPIAGVNFKVSISLFIFKLRASSMLAELGTAELQFRPLTSSNHTSLLAT